MKQTALAALGPALLALLALVAPPSAAQVSQETLESLSTPEKVETRLGTLEFDDGDYQVPFAFTGTIDQLTFALDEPKLTAEDEKRLMEADRKANDHQ